MEKVLDYATPVRSRDLARHLMAAGALAVCWALYFVACFPAISEGASTLELYFQGLAFTWICAIPLTAIFQPWGASRTRMLAAYAVAAGPIFALTGDRGNPPMPVVEFIFESLIFLTPIHLAAAFIIEGLCRLVGKGFLRLFGMWSRRTRLATAIAGALAFTAFMPVTFVLWVHHEGRSRADALWDSHDAYLICSTHRDFSDIGGISGTFYYDDVTGLLLYAPHAITEPWHTAYSARIAHLLKVHGRPAWGAPALPSPAEVVSIFESPDFTEVKAFPLKVTPDITILRSRGGLEVSTARSGSVSTAEGDRVYIGRDLRTPRIVYIKEEDFWMGAFSEDGKFLISVSRH